MRDYTLPFPPSVDRYLMVVNDKAVITPIGRQYRRDVATIAAAAVSESTPKIQRIAVRIVVIPPDARRYDLSALARVAMDAMQYAELYRDGYLIDDLHITRRMRCEDVALHPDGAMLVEISEIPEPMPVWDGGA